MLRIVHVITFIKKIIDIIIIDIDIIVDNSVAISFMMIVISILFLMILVISYIFAKSFDLALFSFTFILSKLNKQFLHLLFTELRNRSISIELLGLSPGLIDITSPIIPLIL